MYLIATISTSLSKKDKLNLIRSGVKVFRYNFSYGSVGDMIKIIRKDQKIFCKKNKLAVKILADLPGSKIRIKQINKKGITVRLGERVVFGSSKIKNIKAKFIPVDFGNIHNIKKGLIITIGDGCLAFKVLRNFENSTILTEALGGGVIYSNKAINIGLAIDNINHLGPALKILPSISEIKPDFISISFVNSADDILMVRKKLKRYNYWKPKIISKIESPLGVRNISEIAKLSDIIMVARGDLGVNCNYERLGIYQHRIIKATKKLGKKVIVATQILDSTINSYTPNRSEISDLTNIVLSGVDGIMLVDEIVQNKFPERSVAAAKKIINQAINYKNNAKE